MGSARCWLHWLLLTSLLVPTLGLADITSNLVRRYACDEGSGTTLTDTSPSPQNGTLVNGATYTAPGQVGAASCLFDGSNDHATSPTTGMTLTASSSYTWAMWIRPTAFPEWQAVWVQGVAGDEPIFLIYVHTTANPGTPVTAGVTAIWVSTGALRHPTTNNVLVADTWAHIAVVYDGSAAQASRFTLYVNAVSVNGTVESSGTIGTITPNTVRIGEDTYGDPFFGGNLDEIYYFDRALTQADVQELLGGTSPKGKRRVIWLR